MLEELPGGSVSKSTSNANMRGRSSSFHSYANMRRRKKHIHSLENNG
jgi:hypothetical protein